MADLGIARMSKEAGLGGTLTRADLADVVHNKLGLSRAESAHLVERVLHHMCHALSVGQNVKIFGGGMVGLQFTPIMESLGSLLNGIVNYNSYVPGIKYPGIEDFLKRYSKKAAEAKVDPLGFYLPPYNYAIGQMLEQAVTATKSLDHKVLADYLRKNVNGTTKYSEFVNPNNASPQMPSGIVGNGARPGQAGNLFSTDMNAWYEVEVLNNVEDPGFAVGDDTDKTIIIRSTGHGPNGAVAQVEWYVRADAVSGLGRPCPSYGQKGMSEDGAGRNDCLTNVVSSDVATYSPGGP